MQAVRLFLRMRSDLAEGVEHMSAESGAQEAGLYQKRLQIALKAAKICVFEVDLKRQMYTFFENAEDIFGVSGEQILRDVQPFSQLPPEEYRQAVSGYFSCPDDANVIERAFRCILEGRSTSYEARMRAGGSRFVWCRLNVTPLLENGVPTKMIGVITDISRIRKRTDRLKKQVRLDAFTGLHNKKYGILAAENILAAAPHCRHALLLIDLDDFKAVNDTYGHAVGDEIIKDFAEHMKRCFRKTDVVSRFGGDEYMVLVQDLPDGHWLADRLEEIMACEHSACGYTSSVGVALFPQDAQTFDGLFEKADRALYDAKTRKHACTFAEDLPE